MKYNFTFLLVFLFTVNCSSAQDAFFKEFQAKWENGKAYTLAVLEAMPDEHLDFSPSEDLLTFGQHLNHLLATMVYHSGHYIKGENMPDFQEVYSKESWTRAELKALLEKSFTFAESVIKEIDEERLKQEVDFFAGPKTVRQVLKVIDDHHTHHRASMILYLRLKGIDAPRYTGW